MTIGVHQRLRIATRGDHERLESRIDILGRAGSASGRRELVLAFHRLHSEAEAALAPWLIDLEGLDFPARRRTAVLERDLMALRVSRPTDLGAPPVVASAAEALGRMYVLEGSTLGGQVVRRSLAAAGQDMTGLGFLEPYGAQAGQRWRSLLAVLDRAVRDGADVDAVIAGAVAGFLHAETCLVGEAAHA